MQVIILSSPSSLYCRGASTLQNRSDEICLSPVPQPWAEVGQHPSLLGSHGMSHIQALGTRPGDVVATLQWAGCWPRMAASSPWGWGTLGREAGLSVAMEGGCSARLTTIRPWRHGCSKMDDTVHVGQLLAAKETCWGMRLGHSLGEWQGLPPKSGRCFSFL